SFPQHPGRPCRRLRKRAGGEDGPPGAKCPKNALQSRVCLTIQGQRFFVQLRRHDPSGSASRSARGAGRPARRRAGGPDRRADRVRPRLSTRDQKLDRQTTALNAAGCIRIFADKKSGKNAEREELAKALDYVRPGDILVVESLDRLGRSLQDLIAIVGGLRRQGVGLRSLKEAIDTTTPGGRLVFHVFAALAEF